ncbi:hypothetical protein C1645_834261 [Glomus cerebriforme]|uniref:Uncharacterized protein n=1 Tax=Glomus cerebriforme TaxID=658196 RepID=A0A397SFV9_9GLOM|nr:hypothetical protein C1645_834261 [Glomus cerebriforme]
MSMANELQKGNTFELMSIYKKEMLNHYPVSDLTEEFLRERSTISSSESFIIHDGMADLSLFEKMELHKKEMTHLVLTEEEFQKFYEEACKSGVEFIRGCNIVDCHQENLYTPNPDIQQEDDEKYLVELYNDFLDFFSSESSNEQSDEGITSQSDEQQEDDVSGLSSRKDNGEELENQSKFHSEELPSKNISSIVNASNELTSISAILSVPEALDAFRSSLMNLESEELNIIREGIIPARNINAAYSKQMK